VYEILVVVLFRVDEGDTFLETIVITFKAIQRHNPEYRNLQHREEFTDYTTGISKIDAMKGAYTRVLDTRTISEI
jgi:hypothetical protein